MMEEVESCGKLGEKRSETRKTQRRQQVNKKIKIKNKKEARVQRSRKWKACCNQRERERNSAERGIIVKSRICFFKFFF